jgi:hypothetical protein
MAQQQAALHEFVQAVSDGAARFSRKGNYF